MTNTMDAMVLDRPKHSLRHARLPRPRPGTGDVGTVVAAGPGVEGFSEGDRVGVPWLGWTCGSLRLLPERAGEPVRPGPLHRVSS